MTKIITTSSERAIEIDLKRAEAVLSDLKNYWAEPVRRGYRIEHTADRLSELAISLGRQMLEHTN